MKTDGNQDIGLAHSHLLLRYTAIMNNLGLSKRLTMKEYVSRTIPQAQEVLYVTKLPKSVQEPSQEQMHLGIWY
ncbi:uncharacterized protein L203_105418 [Cryptococcus depauperatus CBS 7841]|uniref:Uncharacterized protein n=1 Tax=Cryptococcus depauperatus CBS 7841 TaxID=1295531 RepID=A0AAJ8M3Y0_9TREE